MQLRRFDNIQEFWHNAQDYLRQHEAEHNLLLGIAHNLLYYPDGAELHQFQDRGDYWTVNWTTTDGTRPTSAIGKKCIVMSKKLLARLASLKL